MQTQHSLAVSEHKHTNGEYLDRLARYEAAVKRIHSDHDGSAEAFAELSSARQSLSDISRIAKAAFDAKFTPPEGDRLFGKALKDWATAIMRKHGSTRAEAREHILDTILTMTMANSEMPASSYLEIRAVVVPPFNISGCETGRIQSSEPNVTELDHLPEGSH